MYSRDEEQLLQADSILRDEMIRTLEQPGSFFMLFDSAKAITILQPKDQHFRIINWHTAINQDEIIFHCFIQFSDKVKTNQKLIELKNISMEIKQPEQAELKNAEWFGVHYYKMIEGKNNKIKTYTLLGWDGYSMNITRKVIDILYFDTENKPVFGMPFFMISDKKMLARCIFEYAENTAFTLRYEKQALPSGKKKNMIIFDQLMPISESVKGNPAFYVSATNLINGFYLTKNGWKLVRDIDARNTDAKKNKGKIQQGLLPE